MEARNADSLFYWNVFKIAQGMVKSWFINRLLQEMDEFLRGNGNDAGQRVQIGPRPPMFDDRNLQEIVEVFGQRNLERTRFCEIFPRWKENRQGMIAAMELIAQQLHEDKAQTEDLKAATNVIGLTGGLLRAASTFMQEIPGWVGTTGKALSVVSNGVKAGINATEQYNIEKLLRRAKNYSRSDRENFQVLLRWFHYDDDLTKSIQVAIGTDTMEKLFEKFQHFYDQVRNFNEGHPKITAFTEFFENIAGMALPLKAKLAGGLFRIFVIHYADRSRSSWNSSAKSLERIKAGATAMTYSANAILSAQQLRGEWNTPEATYIGIAVDVLPAVWDLCSKKILNGKVSNQGEHIDKVVRDLRNELAYFEEVYDKLRNIDSEPPAQQSSRGTLRR